MPRLYLNVIEADDNQIMLGTPIGMVCEGTAEQVAKLCEANTRAMEELGFKDGGKT